MLVKSCSKMSDIVTSCAYCRCAIMIIITYNEDIGIMNKIERNISSQRGENGSSESLSSSFGLDSTPPGLEMFDKTPDWLMRRHCSSSEISSIPDFITRCSDACFPRRCLRLFTIPIQLRFGEGVGRSKKKSSCGRRAGRGCRHAFIGSRLSKGSRTGVKYFVERIRKSI